MSLSIVLDQNIPQSVAEYIRSLRPEWIVRHVMDIGLSGSSDQVIFDWAQREGAIIITFDEDFADARMYPAGRHAGVVRLRVWPTTVEMTEVALGRLLDTTEDESLRGSLVIVDNKRIRIRRDARHG